MPPPLPKRYQGVWARTLLWSRDGGSDSSTTVRWAQTASLFCDVRQPAGVRVTTRLEECDEAQMKCVSSAVLDAEPGTLLTFCAW